MADTKPCNQPNPGLTLAGAGVPSVSALCAIPPPPHFLDRLFGAGFGVGADALSADRTLLGQLLETFVFKELVRHASWRDDGTRFFHFRDKDGVEVDIVIEHGASAVAGVEVKAGATATEADFRGLRTLEQGAGKRFSRGIELYDGEATLPFGDRLQAVPLRTLWKTA